MSAALAARIETAWGALTPREQRVAAFLRERPDESALYNSSELARVTGVSKATVSRLYRRLGFTASSEVRDLLRQERSAGQPVLLGEEGDQVEAQLRRDVANLERALAVDRDLLRDAAAALAGAGRVVVVGHRSGFPVAMQLRQALAQVRDGVRLAPEQGQSLGEELAGLGAGDVVVLVALRRRAAAVAPLLRALDGSPARVLLIADPAPAPAGRVDWRFAVPIESASPFDSYAAAASLVSVLAGAVLTAAGPAGAARVREVDALYARLGELDRG